MSFKKKKIEVFPTFMKIHNAYKETLNLREKLSTKDYFTDAVVPMAYEYDGVRDIMRVPRGIGVQYVKDLLGNCTVEYKAPFPTKKMLSRLVYTEALHDRQAILRENTVNNYRDLGMTQQALIMPTGEGKSWTLTAIACDLGVRPLIFVKSNLLRDQIKKNILEYTTAESKDVLILDKHSVMNYNLDKDDYDFFVMTQVQYTETLSIPGGLEKLVKIIAKNGIGIKVVDEADLATENVFHFDFRNNIQYNLYTTGTFEKSSKEDDNVFQFSFREVVKNGVAEYKDFVPNRTYTSYIFKSEPNQSESFNMYAKNEKHTFIPSEWALYMLYRRPQLLKSAMREAIDITTRDIETLGKCVNLIFLPSIEACFALRDFLNKEFQIDKRDIGVYNSEVDDKLKLKEMTKTWVITTGESMGRGVDIKGVNNSIIISPKGSVPNSKQMNGRNGRRNGVDGKVFELVDVSIKKIETWYNKRKKRHKESFKSTEEIYMF